MALRLVLVAVLSLSVLSLAHADCSYSAPTDGCKDCNKLNIGFYKGLWLESSTSASVAGVGAEVSVAASASVAATVRNINYDSYGWGTPIFQSWAAAKRSELTLSECCKACKANSTCKLFQFWTADQLSAAPAAPAQCYLLSAAPTGINIGGAFNWLGGYCNAAPGQTFPPPPPPKATTASPPPASPPPPIPTVVSLPPPGVKGDPHFTGWDGVHFDFTGQPGKSYCLLSDSKVHVNMHLDGYESANEDGVKETHSWIKGVGVVTLVHTVALFAREGVEPARGAGYIKRIVVDGKEISLPEAEDKFATADGEVSVQYMGHKIDGDDDIDIYSVAVTDTITLLLKMRPEIPSLRTDKEAWVHFSLEVLDEQLSQQTHGILGQTLYNYNHPEAAPTGYPVEYSGVVWAWQVVGPDGDRYIQGKPADYATSNLLRTDCRFSQFARRGVFHSALSLACWKNAFVC